MLMAASTSPDRSMSAALSEAPEDQSAASYIPP